MKSTLKYNWLILLIFLTVNINSYSQDNLQNSPKSKWQYHQSIEKVGYDSDKIQDIKKYIADSLSTTGLMVITEGKVLFDYGNLEELSYIASCRKSLLAMLYGKYVENKTINLDLTLNDIGVDDIQGLLPIEKRATIRNLISARSGIYHPRSNGGDNTNDAPKRGSVEPGTYFLYNNWDFNAAGGIFEQLTKKNIYKAFKDDIAIPIQLQDYRLDKQEKSGDSTKSKYMAYHFWQSTRDMARVGLLMLNKGNWNGKQVISEDWVKQITEVVTPANQMHPSYYKDRVEYGYMWWIWYSDNEDFEGAYYAAGAYGQFLLVLPKLDMVISHKTKYGDNRRTRYQEFEKLVYKIIDSKN